MVFIGWITHYDLWKKCGTIRFVDGDSENTIRFYKEQCNSTIRKRLAIGELPPVTFEIGFLGQHAEKGDHAEKGAHAIDVKGRNDHDFESSPYKSPPYNTAFDELVRARLRNEFPNAPKVSEVVRYNIEHWEEIQELIDPKPTEVDAPPQQLLNTPAPEDYLALGIFSDKVRLVRLASDGKYSFVDAERETHRILYPSVFPDLRLTWVIEEFEELLNSKTPQELDFQRFFERNPEFILGDEYKYAHPHVTLVSNEGREVIPDFILQPVNQFALCDLLDLKLPTTNLYVFQKNRQRYSAAVHEAAAQLRTYASFFDDKDNALRFTLRYPHLSVYKPKMFVIIGRDTPEMLEEKQAIRRSLPDLNLNTYDDLLERMRWRKELLRKGGPILGF